jgi:hypothetical protein
MSRFSGHWRCTIYLTVGFDEFKRIKQTATLVALVTSCIVVLTLGAGAFNKAVGEEGLMCFAVWLCCSSLFHVSVVIELCEYILCNDCLLFCSCSSKVIEVDLKPIINCFVLQVEFVTQLLWRLTRLKSFCLCCSTILVCSADEERRSVSELAEPRKNICTEDAANDVAEVGDVTSSD